MAQFALLPSASISIFYLLPAAPGFTPAFGFFGMLYMYSGLVMSTTGRSESEWSVWPFSRSVCKSGLGGSLDWRTFGVGLEDSSSNAASVSELPLSSGTELVGVDVEYESDNGDGVFSVGDNV